MKFFKKFLSYLLIAVLLFLQGLVYPIVAYAVAAAVEDPVTVAEDSGATTINVLANDGGVTKTITAVTQSSNGSVAITHDGADLTYTPNANFNGSDTFDYTETDSSDISTSIGHVNVTVTAVNDPPGANSDNASTQEDTAVSIAVLANDTDVDGNIDPSTVAVTSGPSNGSTAVNSTTGAITYTPAGNFNGSDSFFYQMCDSVGTCAGTTDYITVNAVNDPPSFDAIANQTIAEDASLQSIIASNISPGPPNESGQTVTLSTISSNTAIIPHPSVNMLNPSELRYTPVANANGTATITVTANDGQAQNNTFSQTLTITVTAVNDAPAITVNSPNGGEIWVGGSSHALTWNASDVDDVSNTLIADLLYTTNGTDFTSIVSGLTNSGTYTWNPIASLDSLTVKIKTIATDLSNSIGTDLSDANFTVDSTAPTGSIFINDGSSYTNSASVSLDFSGVSSDVTTLEIGNGEVGSYQNPVAYSNPYPYTLPENGDGNYVVRVRFTDSAGNKNSGVISDTIILDTTAPTLIEVTPVTTPTNNSNPSYTFNSDEAGTIVYGGSCSSQTADAVSGDNSITLDSLWDGDFNDCLIQVTDAAGNPSDLNVSTFTVDTTGPDTSSLNPSIETINNNGYIKGIVTVSGYVTDSSNVSSVGFNINDFDAGGDQEISCDGAQDLDDPTLWSCTIDTTTLQDSSAQDYDMKITASDSLNNTTTEYYSDWNSYFDIDNITPPEIALNSDNPQTIELGNLYEELGATATDNFDGDLTSSIITDATNVDISTVGSYIVTYNVTDSSGNSNQVTRTVDVVDTTAPTNQDTVFSSSVNKQGGVSVTIISSEDATNNVWFAPSGTIEFTEGTTMTRADGDATSILAPADEDVYRLFAIDAAGNVSNESEATLRVDNTAPDVTKLGDNSADVVLNIGDTILYFGEALSDSSKTKVENALTAGADKELAYEWSDSMNLTVTATETTTFTNDVVVSVSDVAGNSAELLLVDSVLSSTQKAPDESGDVTVDDTTPEVVITDPDQEVDITIDSGTDNPTINVSSFITGGTGTLPKITIDSEKADIAIPASTVVTSADPTWDGILAAPTITTTTLPQTAGVTKTLSTAIEVGFSSAKLSFDKGVRLLIPNQAGKSVGYSRPGIDFTEITVTCAADNQATGDALATDGDCKIDSGLDLVIWTKHFTQFATYTQTTNSSSTTSTNGGGSLSAASPPSCGDQKPGSAPTLLNATPGLNSVTLKWNKAANPVTYYLVNYSLISGKFQYGNPSVGGPETTSYTVGGLSGGTTYYFKVRAGNGCAPGDYSNELATTPGGGFISTPATGFIEGVLGTQTEAEQTLSVETQSGDNQIKESTSTNLFATIGNFFKGIFSFFTGLFK